VIRKYGAGLVVLTERGYSLCTCGEPNEMSHLQKKKRNWTAHPRDEQFTGEG